MNRDSWDESLARIFVGVRQSGQLLGPFLAAALTLLLMRLTVANLLPALLGRLRPELARVAHVPRFASVVLIGSALSVIVTYVMARTERRRAFWRPVQALLRGDVSHPAGLPFFRSLVLLGLPPLLWWSLGVATMDPKVPAPVALTRLPAGAEDPAWTEITATRIELFGPPGAPLEPAYLKLSRQGLSMAARVELAPASVAGVTTEVELWLLPQNPDRPRPRPPGLGPLSLASERWRWRADESGSELQGGRLAVQVQGSLARMAAAEGADWLLGLSFARSRDAQLTTYRSVWQVGLSGERDETEGLSLWWLWGFYGLELVAMTLAISRDGEP